MDPNLATALIAAGAVAVTGIITGLVTWMTARRASSGKVNTSEAATLWAASEAIRDDITTRLDKVTEQRDRLVESQTALIIPVLASINESLRQIAESLARAEADNGG